MRYLTYVLVAVARLATAWPDLPLTVSGRWMVNAKGQNVTYVGVNWQGAADTMLPEGLQYSSIENTVSKIKSLGMNVIRLTWAVEMVDDIYSNNPNSTLQNTLTHALGEENGVQVFNEILKFNPQFSANTTRLDAFDAVAAECNRQQIYIHLDNHVSKAMQCCIPGDGNGWFGSTYFNVSNWHRGLAFMANHGKSWPNLASMALRNELRPEPNTPVQNDYSWSGWYTNMVAGGYSVYNANQGPLIVFSGMNSDHDLSDAVDGEDLGNGTVFDISSFNYSSKVVFEYHDYGSNTPTYNCTADAVGLEGLGYNAMDTSPNTTAKNIAPVLTTEWGFQQDDSYFLGSYPLCLKLFLTSIQGGWMQWALSGSLYIKWGQQDSDDTWGLLNHDWTAWRSNASVYDYTLPFVQQTLAGLINPADTSVFNASLLPLINSTAVNGTSSNSTSNITTTTTSAGPSSSAFGSLTSSATKSGQTSSSSKAGAETLLPTAMVGAAALFFGAWQVGL